MSNIQNVKYKREVTALERMFIRSPFTIVTMVARIKGEVREPELREAISKVQKRHLNLQLRMIEDEEEKSWFTTDGVEEIPIRIVPRLSSAQWMEVIEEEFQIPFEFDTRPAIRFILVQSSNLSELIIYCHHIICDGLSLAYLARDILDHLGDPTREVEVLPAPVLIDKQNLPPEVRLNPVVRFFINRMNKKWVKNKVFFGQKDYVALNEAYWKNEKHKMVSIELSESQTSRIVKQCKEEGVTVNTALSTAFIGAQALILGEIFDPSLAVGGSLRNRLQEPVGEVMGFYAGAVISKFKYEQKNSFWENARRFHKTISPLYTNKHLFKDPVNWCYLAPGILDAFPFKMLGHLVPPESSRFEKISNFKKQNDVVQTLLKGEKMHTFDTILLGTAITNLTRLDFPRQYGTLELDRLIMNPGGAFPLVFVNLVVGAVTCAGKLSILLEYSDKNLDTDSVRKIETKALEFLLKED